MSKGKATVPSAAEMLSTMEVRARMFPCSGESATLKRSAKRPNHMFRIYMRVPFMLSRECVCEVYSPSLL